MRKTTKVLALGHEEWTHAVRQALPHWQKNCFVAVNNFWNLCVLPEPVSADIAVIDDSFAQSYVRYAAQYIRRRWPEAVIVVIGEQAKQLDDPLFDNHVSDETSPGELVWLIETLAAAGKRIKKCVRPGPGGVRR